MTPFGAEEDFEEEENNSDSDSEERSVEDLFSDSDKEDNF